MLKTARVVASASATNRRVAFGAPLALCLLLVAGCAGSAETASSTSSATSADGLTAYVTNSQDNGKAPGMGTVIPINLTDQLPGTPIQVGQGAGTNDIVITADGKTAFVTNEYTNSVTRIDLGTGELGKPITVGAEPVAISFVPQTNEGWAWVANYDGKSISTINLATGALGQTIAVPHAGPNTVAFTPDGKTCYVANWGTTEAAGSTVTPIEVTDGGAGGRVLPSIKVGDNPNWIAITNDGSTAYVANKGSDSITPITVADNTAGTAIPVPGPPIEMEIAPNGNLAYVAIAGSEPEIDEVVPMDLSTTPATVGPAIKLAPKSQPHWIAFTPDGQTAYVVGNGNSTLTPITVASGTPGTPIQVSNDPDSDLLAIAITSK
jgi:DNA-binding beta-propeller fold protein YncE